LSSEEIRLRCLELALAIAPGCVEDLTARAELLEAWVHFAPGRPGHVEELLPYPLPPGTGPDELT
jgi:hypothetical protein